MNRRAGSGRLPLFKTISNTQNRRLRAVNRRLSFEVTPYKYKSQMYEYRVKLLTSQPLTILLFHRGLKSEPIAFHRHGSASVWISVFSVFVLVFKCTAQFATFQIIHR